MKTAIRKKGQTMTEVVIITGLVAIAAIAVVTLFGAQLKGLWAYFITMLTGAQDSMR
jgi:Flp pilus assembly pilin Flp